MTMLKASALKLYNSLHNYHISLSKVACLHDDNSSKDQTSIAQKLAENVSTLRQNSPF